MDAKCKLYRVLLEKYSKLISEHERKTVGQIKSMINKEELTVRMISEKLKGSDYSYERDFLSAAQKALDLLSNEIEYVELDISMDFWLSPSEIMRFKVSDDEDLAIMLCSILLSLGNENASVLIVRLDDLRIHSFVIFKFKNRYYIADPSQKHSLEEFSGESEEEALEKYRFNGQGIRKLLYKFNKNEYIDFGE